MSNALELLLKVSQKVKMTDDQREEQEIRFSYASAKIENDDVTEEMVRDAAKRMKAEETSSHG